MKKFFRWFGIGVGSLFFLIVLVGWAIHEPKPESNPSPEADALARKMVEAVDGAAWDTTTFVQWTFAGSHQFLWDKERNLVRVSWSDNIVLLNTKTSQGVAYEDETEVSGEDARELVQKAQDLFNNDSFWLNAPVKIFDPGTERSLVTLDDGRSGLMVSYRSGGTTPGDSYVWLLDEHGLPQSWKLWVSIIPVGGVEVSWDAWTELASGARIATQHQGGPLTLKISDVRSAPNWVELGFTNDPFATLVNKKKEDS